MVGASHLLPARGSVALGTKSVGRAPYAGGAADGTLRPALGGRRPKVIDQQKLFSQIKYVPHSGQQEILRDRTRNQVVAAGRRFGKSDMGGHKLVGEAFLAYYMRQALADADKRREFWIVGPEYTDAEKEFRVLWNVLKRLEVPFDKPGTYNDPIGGNMHISLWDGRFQVHAKSARHPETLVGEGLSGVIMAEAAKLKESVWTKYIRPMLSDQIGWSLMASTPEGKNWFYRVWQLGQRESNLEWASWRRPSWSNPYVYRTTTVYSDVLRMQSLLAPGGSQLMTEAQLAATMDRLSIDDEIRSLVRDLPDEVFNQEVAALFTEFVGRVFKDFDEEIHVRDVEYDPKWATYGANDYGFTNPNVWLLIQVGPWGEITVLDEIYQSGLTAEEFADEINRRGLAPSSMRRFYPDPASPGDTRILEQRLKVKAGGGTGGELRWRLDAIRKALKRTPAHLPDSHPDKTPTIMISPRCEHLIDDMNNYRYPDKRESARNRPELPLKQDDHGPEALGRFFAGLYGTPQRDARRARVAPSSISG